MDNRNFRNTISLSVAIICALILGIVGIINRPVTTEDDFGVDSYYIPIQQVPRKSSAQNESYASFVSLRSVECPGFGNNQTPAGATYTTNGVYAGRQASIKFSNFLFTRNELEGPSGTYNSIKRATIANVLSLNTDLEQIVDKKFDEMLNKSPTFSADPEGKIKCYEIVAPFAFSFENSNMDTERGKIVIMNMNRTCRITINNVANWYCAGTPGTEMETDSRKDEGHVTWLNHDNKHLTWVGKHNNSKKRSGSSGELIGYGNSDTTFTIEMHTDKGWEPIGWKEIYSLS